MGWRHTWKNGSLRQINRETDKQTGGRKIRRIKEVEKRKSKRKKKKEQKEKKTEIEGTREQDEQSVVKFVDRHEK